MLVGVVFDAPGVELAVALDPNVALLFFKAVAGVVAFDLETPANGPPGGVLGSGGSLDFVDGRESPAAGAGVG